MTIAANTTEANTENTVPVVIVSHTGEETIKVPATIANEDDQLRAVLVAAGVSGAENGTIERGEDGSIKLTKRAGTNG